MTKGNELLIASCGGIRENIDEESSLAIIEERGLWNRR